MKKIALITPFPPYRGGISAHSKNLYDTLSLQSEVVVYNFSKQYPNFLFPGRTQYDNSTMLSESYNIIRILDTMNPFSWRKVSNSIIKNKFDKVIFRFWNPFFALCYISIAKALKNNNKDIQIYSICDNIIPHEKFISQNFFVKLFLNQLDGIIIMSNSAEKELLNLNKSYNYKKLFLPIIDSLGNSLDYHSSKKEIGLKKASNVFLFFGLIREYKGLDILLNAINKLDLDFISRSDFLIVGESYEDIDKYKNILDDEKKPHVKWITEYIPDNKINLYFSASDYVVLPYKTASQSGIIPMAYHFKKPVIVSKIEGLKEIVIDGETGYTFNNSNIYDLKAILEKCIQSDNNIVPNSIEELKNKLSTESFVKKLNSFINE